MNPLSGLIGALAEPFRRSEWEDFINSGQDFGRELSVPERGLDHLVEFYRRPVVPQ